MARGFGAEFGEGEVLGAGDGIVEAADGVAGPAADDGAGDVAEVAGFLGARKDVKDDRLVGAQRAVARFVRVAGLGAAGDDGVAGEAAGLEDGDVNDGAEFFRGRGARRGRRVCRRGQFWRI